LTPRTVAQPNRPEVRVSDIPVEADRGRPLLAELRVVPPEALVVLTGEIDLHNVEQLRAALTAVVANPVRLLVVDLSALGFASLGALASIVDTAHALSVQGGRVQVRGARPLHRRVLRLLGTPPGLVVMDAAAG
jgi:anti-anti-sigma factor